MNRFSWLRVCWPALWLIVSLIVLTVSYPGSKFVVQVLEQSVWPILWFGLGAMVLRFRLFKRALKLGAWGVAFLLWLIFFLMKPQHDLEYNFICLGQAAPAAGLASVPLLGPPLVSMLICEQVRQTVEPAARRGESMMSSKYLEDMALAKAQACIGGFMFAFAISLLGWPGRLPLSGAKPQDSGATPGADRAWPQASYGFDDGTTISLAWIDDLPTMPKQLHAAAPLPAAAQGHAAGAAAALPETEAAALWHVLEDDVVRGPFPLADLAARLVSASLPLHTSVRRVGTQAWVPLRAEVLRFLSHEPRASATPASLVLGAAGRPPQAAAAAPEWKVAPAPETHEMDALDKCLRYLRGEAPARAPRRAAGPHGPGASQPAEQDALENLLGPLLALPAALRVLLVLVLLGAAGYYMVKWVQAKSAASACLSTQVLQQV